MTVHVSLHASMDLKRQTVKFFATACPLSMRRYQYRYNCGSYTKFNQPGDLFSSKFGPRSDPGSVLDQNYRKRRQHDAYQPQHNA